MAPVQIFRSVCRILFACTIISQMSEFYRSLVQTFWNLNVLNNAAAELLSKQKQISGTERLKSSSWVYPSMLILLLFSGLLISG